MTYDFTAAGGDAVLLEQLAFDQQDHQRYYPIITSTQSPQNITSTALTTMSQSARQSLSPGATWLPADLSGGMSAPNSIHSPSSSMSPSSPEDQNCQSPGNSVMSSPLQQQQHSPLQHSPLQTGTHLFPDWTAFPMQTQQQQQQQQHQQHVSDMPQFISNEPLLALTNHFMPNFHQPSAFDYLPATTQAAIENTLHLEAPFNHAISPVEETSQQLQWSTGTGTQMANWQDFEMAMNFNQHNELARMPMGSHSPTGSFLEVLSLHSGSDNGWATVDMPLFQDYNNFTQPQPAQNTAIFNPGQTLHLRTTSELSQQSDFTEFGSYEEVTFPYSPFSTESDGFMDMTNNRHGCCSGDHHHHSPQPTEISPSSAVAPVPIKAGSSRAVTANGSGSVSPPPRRITGPRKSPTAKPSKTIVRRTNSTGKKDGTGEKKVGRRRGPLLPEQRKQASEIRKLRACLRCKFLKKTCDKGEPCAGCQPSHARLWQVPCTRIDIKDIGYFMKDWKADYERHLGRGMSVFNVKGFAQKETLMWITHGYGFCLPVMVREVFVADESCFQVDWVESTLTDQEPIDFEIRTERLDVGHEGVSVEALSEYLDKHVDEGFEQFIDDHFEGTPFITELFKTAHRFYVKERLPVIRKALKLVVAYNLTLHITMVEQPPTEQPMEGQIDDEDSKYFGKVVAPVMINFQIKCAMADMWRELQKEVLEELSALYSSVYSGERLKNWPTIFMLAAILLAVWEEIQFDCHYRVPDPIAVNKFCDDMESTPVGVIVGLFHAISQKLPAFTEWDTRRHGQLLNNNVAVCEAMTEVRQHVLKHESYLRTRQETKFDRYDFDSLSNKFLSKLVIRAN
ncbi:hypothetical protein NEUTE1DRAFT_88208 [Neurospora tetrasperma FGSC 2508]|uniref:Zn(2)-C6 fungal-type domain-containing protein n=1 Tax=Neurospora tetrasperma (strain FGSC 2508 / ATCC MYA-4615 / P0657) TaxID=510951 RepID=F8MV45_NEUT8|nr:uncharacterized protein NEUTE1DRAFT_88208 [Neurospora tetrasperma FGSC 2508]EGO54670.1 hypothetical protein NEUTE1DRAFT_88208 [Neurospora tetrasperma FGSC 2508]EGZ67857.1 hypothetical protein NEUTE2DRAFT_160355 [Neurospora tetrasperma FGSC 2509]